MAPTKVTRPIIPTLSSRVTTRSKANNANIIVKGKRKADGSPSKETAVKRSALGDLTTNTLAKAKNDDKSKIISKNAVSKKVLVQARVLPSVRTVAKPKQNENQVPPAAPAQKILTRASLRSIPAPPNQTAQKPKEAVKDVVTSKVKTRLSNEFEKTEESLYCTALEDVTVNGSANASNKSNDKMSITMVAHQMEKQLNLGNHNVPEDVNDFDRENWDDVFQISHYAMDIFNYLKAREATFITNDYMDRQVCLTRWMRSLLIDWMVEIQESFELNHETLYLGVKLVDLYLSKMTVGKETLQLVGAAAMFIASKYDERIPPLVDDFLYICDGAYTRKELLKMEINLLKVCGFDLGIPLSYRFLRRYARCSKVTMPILTLARYILEYSLMDYSTVTISDSKLASSALYLALKMKQVSGWTSTLEFYTGYKLEDILSTVHVLNNGLHRKPKEQLMTVRNKYSHKIFFEVAMTPLVKNEDLIV
ncbi:PREDICTED: G2/mitotic-specific cyclin-B3 [Nicrophorus vespilloides]|uniref:G2/mitotic-specific cyclin-B3 n=1 Tax=Nicrophorus vespilloides TaxID=110193 RepID=A0ABM1M003_NICVS|nr:PREDICTED: G2/mitotic-specific cyclin-B3 [Nicrophorus vespilloides]